MESFVTITADPPWEYGDKLRMSDTARSSTDVYRNTMTVEEICDFRAGPWIYGQHIADDALLWLWITEPFLLDGIGKQVCEAWGFEQKTVFHWIKGRIEDDSIVGPLGMGHYLRVDTESIIVAARGKATQLIQDHSIRNYTFVAPKGRHSEKPQIFYDIVQCLSPGPYLELFGREKREGWTVIGDELEVWT